MDKAQKKTKSQQGAGNRAAEESYCSGEGPGPKQGLVVAESQIVLPMDLGQGRLRVCSGASPLDMVSE